MATPEVTEALDLGGLMTCLNGAEPIRPATLEAFAGAFAGTGLRPGAPSPGYGLAEATVFVTAAADDTPPKTITVDRAALAEGVLRAEPDSHPDPGQPEVSPRVSLVSCGRPVGQLVAVVDPASRTECPDGRVGEIWVHGPNVADGYWRDPERTEETFGGELEGASGGPWLRTGDHGVVHEGELYVTGRIKDLIIVDGRNHYPQDIELTVQEAHAAVRPDHVAAFAVPGESTERLVVVAERNRREPLARLDPDEVESAVRAAIGVEHELSLHAFVLVEPGAVARTSSGKVARTATRQRYLANELHTTERRFADRD
jgi:fatty acid CoA ligase FadD32